MNPTNSLTTCTAPARDFAERVLVRTLRLDLSAAARESIVLKAAPLFRHHARVIRVRLDLAKGNAHDREETFVARGRVELSGPDLTAEATSDRVAKSVDLLIAKLDRMLRERTKARANRRNDRPVGTEFRDRIAAPPVQSVQPGGEP